jgi:hypothetical protein
MYSDEFIGRLEAGLRGALPRWGLPHDAAVSLLTVSENATFRVNDAAAARTSFSVSTALAITHEPRSSPS